MGRNVISEPAVMQMPASMLLHSTSRMPETRMSVNGSCTAIRAQEATMPIEPRTSSDAADTFAIVLSLVLHRAKTPRRVNVMSDAVLRKLHAMLTLTNACWVGHQSDPLCIVSICMHGPKCLNLRVH